MKEIGVRELKSQLTNVVRTVREEQTEYTVTVRGQPVAVLRPFTQEDARRAEYKKIDDELAALDELAQEIGAAWSSPRSGVEILEALREESSCR